VVGGKCNQNMSYAIKKIKFSADEESQFLRKLETCSIIARLDEKRLLKYYDVWLEQVLTENEFELKNFILYIRMELCDYSLKHIIEQTKEDSNLRGQHCLTPLGYYIAGQLFIRVVEGVQYLHEREKPFIHRDLKPNNIFLKIESDNSASVKIGDYGLAEIHKYAVLPKYEPENQRKNIDSQSHSTDKQHIEYMAPELIEGTKYDIKADIYSLGIIFNELLDIDTYRFEK